jgi:hypothetical protein
MNMLSAIWLVFQKDMKLELRTGEILISTASFRSWSR